MLSGHFAYRFLRSCVVGVLGWKYGLFQYKINFWETNESFEYLADQVSEIFNESKKSTLKLTG